MKKLCTSLIIEITKFLRDIDSLYFLTSDRNLSTKMNCYIPKKIFNIDAYQICKEKYDIRRVRCIINKQNMEGLNIERKASLDIIFDSESNFDDIGVLIFANNLVNLDINTNNFLNLQKEKRRLPSSLRSLNISDNGKRNFKREMIDFDIIPDEIERLSIMIDEDKIPEVNYAERFPNLIHIKLPNNFNYPIDDGEKSIFPKTLRAINLPFSFNQKINRFPEGLEKLSIFIKNGKQLKMIESLSGNIWPTRLRELSIYSRDKDWISLPNLPNSIESLITNMEMMKINLPRLRELNTTHCIYISNPEKLEKLIICPNIYSISDQKYDQIAKWIKGLLPNLTNLKNIQGNIIEPLLDYLPSTLKTISIFMDFKSLEGLARFKIKDLHLPDSFNSPLYGLPERLKHLFVGKKFNTPIDNLPEGIEKLHLGQEFNQEVNHLPKSLIKLLIRGNFNKALDKLPDGLRDLIIDGPFDHSLDKLPELESLCLTSDDFNRSLDSLPKSLSYLSIDLKNFSRALNSLPSSLDTLVLRLKYYIHGLEHLPKSLRHLNFGLTMPESVFFPPKLHSLKVAGNTWTGINNIPDSIRYLELSVDFTTLMTSFPNDLRVIRLYDRSLIKISIPNNLLLIILDKEYDEFDIFNE